MMTARKGLTEVEKERHDPKPFGSRPGHVSRADVATAERPDVLLAEGTNKEVTEGDRTEEVGDRDRKEGRGSWAAETSLARWLSAFVRSGNRIPFADTKLAPEDADSELVLEKGVLPSLSSGSFWRQEQVRAPAKSFSSEWTRARVGARLEELTT